jgi:5-(carboxyamino)imidazole ribonucleotide synthase
MIALAGYPLGLRFRFLDPVAGVPADYVAERVSGSFEDDAALRSLADGVTAVTYEFENVPVEPARRLADRTYLFPPAQALEAAQDRLSEKTLFQSHGIPVPPFEAVDSLAALQAAVAKIGLPAVLKTRRMGYDGKGQAVLRDAGDVAKAWDALGGVPLILEGFVAFDTEVSIIAVRSKRGETAFYPLVENEHQAGILRLSRVPARGAATRLQAEAEAHATQVLDSLDYVGVLTIEFFVAGERLLANEMAPRVHNSGHWTIEGAETSQFENHLRAGLGLPLGSTKAHRPAAMLNLIGTLPSAEAVLSVEGAHLHLYDKEPRPGRKLGHITVLADSPGELDQKIAILKKLIG